MKKKCIAQSAFSRKHVAIALLLCGAACSIVAGTVLGFFRTEAPTKGTQLAGAGLTFAERVAYQRAIEEVYWQHRIWPRSRGENSKPKPSLDEVMSAQQIEKKVEDYLRDTKALEDYWQRPIAAEQLQAEMERMTRNTKQPEVLRELFEALGNDPFLIAECLARPVLTERLVTNLDRHDQKQLSSSQAKAKTQVPREVAAIDSIAKAVQVNRPYRLPAVASPSGGCADDTWTATSTTNAPEARARHVAVWTGSEMIVWGGIGTGDLNTGGRYNPSTDSWAATTTTNAPDGRYYHTAVWTGSEMIVWGGYNGSGYVNTGGRYNPSTDSWTVTSITNAPEARYLHTAVWTGSEMIVWGGYGTSDFFNTGGRYNPSTDGWTATSTTNAPEARAQHHPAVWTGSEMIVWGGAFFDGTNYHYFNTGGKYNPSTDSWTATSITNAPDGRDDHTPVWTGSEMIVWGGYDESGVINTGGRYRPSTDGWAATSTINAPVARYLHRAVWTDSEMIVWGGGNGSSAFNTGGRYNPGTDTWIATSTTNAPSARLQHTAVWTGSEMVIWGGSFTSTTGGRYCAQSGAPSPTPSATATATPASPTPTVTATPTATPTSTPRPSPTPRPALTPRPRPTPPPRP